MNTDPFLIYNLLSIAMSSDVYSEFGGYTKKKPRHLSWEEPTVRIRDEQYKESRKKRKRKIQQRKKKKGY